MKTTQASKEKKQSVKQIQELVNKHKVIGIVDMEMLPAKQFQRMTQKLKGTARIYMTKKRLIRIAFKNLKQSHIQELLESMRGMPALVLSNEDPFKLYKE